jgi:AcrR family transcriptional regulator
MGVTERRERERQDVRRRILEAARELFQRDGYDRVTMRGVAEAIEYSPTALYYHFKDKDELMECLCREDFGRLLEAFRSARLPDDPIERLRVIGRTYIQFGLDHPNHYRFLFLTPPLGGRDAPPDRSDQPPHPGEESYAVLHRLIEEAMAAGRLTPLDSHLVAQVLWTSVHGITSLLVTLPPAFWPLSEPHGDLIQEAVDNPLRGFLADGVTLAPSAPPPPRRGGKGA